MLSELWSLAEATYSFRGADGTPWRGPWAVQRTDSIAPGCSLQPPEMPRSGQGRSVRLERSWRPVPAETSPSPTPPPGPRLGLRHAAPPPLAPLKPPQAPGPRVPPGQDEAFAGGAEPRPPRPCCHSRPASWPASQQKVAAALQQAWAAAGRIPRRHPQRAAPAPRALLAAPEHRQHRHREARPPATLVAAHAHHRHLHRCHAREREDGVSRVQGTPGVCCAGQGAGLLCLPTVVLSAEFPQADAVAATCRLAVRGTIWGCGEIGTQLSPPLPGALPLTVGKELTLGLWRAAFSEPGVWNLCRGKGPGWVGCRCKEMGGGPPHWPNDTH